MNLLNLQKLQWYRRRLGSMSPAEVKWRMVDSARQQWWRRAQVPVGAPARVPATATASPMFAARLPRPAAELIPAGAAEAVLAAADEVLKGTWRVLGVDPQGSRRPPTGSSIRSPAGEPRKPTTASLSITDPNW